MAFFSKADAKVRTIFESPKLFRSFFQKVFFERRFVGLIFVSVFQLICVSLSKAGAKLLLYNIGSKLLKHFFGDFLHLLHKLLILNHAEKPRVPGLSCGSEPPIYLIIIISTIALEEDKFYRENGRKKKNKNEKVGISPFTAFTLQRNYEG